MQQQSDDCPAEQSESLGRDADEQAYLRHLVTELFEQQITFNKYLGFRIVSLSPDPVRIQFDMRPELVGHFLYGRLHGGVISSVLDVTGGLAVMLGIANYYAEDSAQAVLHRFRHLATIDLRVDYLRQGIGESFEAQGSIVRLGKRVAATRMELYNHEKTLIATGNANYIVS